MKINFPIWTADPAVGWYNENDTIAETDGATDEVEVIPTKTAGLTPVSNELAEHSTPAAVDLIAAGLSNQITRAIDGAYLANTTAKGPNGLLSIGYTPVDTGASLTNLDPFITARYAAKSNGSDLTSWIMAPAAGRQRLEPVADPVCGGRHHSCRSAGNRFRSGRRRHQVLGIPQAHVVLVMRKGTKVEKFPSVRQDGPWIRAVSRLGIGFLNEPGVVRGHDTA